MGERERSELVVVGNVVLDVLAHPLRRFPDPERSSEVDTVGLAAGGCGYHTAVTAAVLGVDTDLIGRVGDDSAGESVRASVRRHATLRPRGVRATPGRPTNVTIVLIDPGGGRRFLVGQGGASSLMELDETDEEIALAGRHLHFSGFGLSPAVTGTRVASLLERARSRGLTTSIDLAWIERADHERWLLPCLPHLDFLTPNVDEARVASGQADAAACGRWFVERGVGVALITQGDGGVVVASRDRVFRMGSFQVPVVDTTGAGDSFAGGFLTAVLRPEVTRSTGDLLAAQVAFGAACGALACTGIGGEAGPTSLSQVHDLLASQSPVVDEL